MAGGHVKYRHLSRKSSARQALLRGLVTSLVAHEHIQTTYAKAKEAQRMAEKLITLAKRNNAETKRKVQAILYTPHDLMPKVFGELRERYAERPGGYTRVLRTEPRNPYDQAPSAILELLDGPRDIRFGMTAKAVARDRENGTQSTRLTRLNKAKVTRYRKDGDRAFEDLVKRFSETSIQKERRMELFDKKKRKERRRADQEEYERVSGERARHHFLRMKLERAQSARIRKARAKVTAKVQAKEQARLGAKSRAAKAAKRDQSKVVAGQDQTKA